MSRYPVNHSLCVTPGPGKESQYEAFQSILAAIMTVTYPSPRNPDDLSPYELLCRQYRIELVGLARGQSPSRYNPMEGIEAIVFETTHITHYIGRINNGGSIMTLDPYASVQAKDTQGFCQLFAFFLIIDSANFIQIDQSKKIDVDNFLNLGLNTRLCFSKFLVILDAFPEIRARFKRDFEKIDFVYYGIAAGTTYEKYIADFKTINDDKHAALYYIYDQPLEGWLGRAPKETLWEAIYDIQ